MPCARAKLTAIVTSFNEERHIVDCLSSLQFADEVLLVDSFSTDATLALAQPLVSRVMCHMYASPAAQKNWAIPQASHEWVLILDSDERVTDELRSEIQATLANPRHDGYWIRRRNFFWGREIKYGAWRSDKVLRLFKRDVGRYEDRQVHEEIRLLTSPGWLKTRLLHYSYASLDDFYRKASRYGHWGAMDAIKRGVRPSAWRIFAHSLGHFLKSYLLAAGFLDGPRGLVIAFMEAHHAFSKYARLYEMRQLGPRS